MRYRIGVDLGGTNIKIGIVDEQGKIKCSSTIKTFAQNGMKITLARIWNEIEKLLKYNEIQNKEIYGIGMGVPGAVMDGRKVGFYANLPWQIGIDVAELMESITGKRVKLENDANVWALAESKYGAGKKFKNCIAITIGTGIGAGICIDQRILSGATGAGGEIGHIKLEREGKKCGCGQRGCFEAYASATGLLNETKSRLEQLKKEGKEHFFMTKEKMEAKDIFDSARNMDEFSLDLIEYEAEYLAQGLGNIINIINPDILILGGGISLAGEILLNPVKEKLKKYALPITLEKIKIEIAKMGNEAGIIGAASLIEIE
jgi:glucokinase